MVGEDGEVGVYAEDVGEVWLGGGGGGIGRRRGGGEQPSREKDRQSHCEGLVGAIE